MSSIPSTALGSNTGQERVQPLYVPPSPDRSRLHSFIERVNTTRGTAFSSYLDFYNWSISQTDQFWSDVWDDTGVLGFKGSHVVDTTALPPDNPPWFAEARLNWAENMLHCRSASKTALIEVSEPLPSRPKPPLQRMTYAELYELVANLVSALLSLGLKSGDRVASYSSNCTENVAACLAATAIGCIWVSAAADFGPEGVLERFEQVQPKIIFSVDSVVYNAKIHQHLPKLKTLLAELSDRSSLKPTIIIIQKSTLDDRSTWSPNWVGFRDFVNLGKEKKLGRTPDGEIEWARLGFDWPLWILFSSGTTGRPKPIVHRAGGMLLQSKKELVLCADLSPDDVYFYYTTTGWMMWNFLVSGLSVGCTLVLYDGSPLRDPAFLWHLSDDLGISIFGTSAKYIDQLSKVYKPKDEHRLTALRHIYSTGSPLAAPLFDFVYEHIKKDVVLGSITGGTDICSLFAGMNTSLPVYRGEIQCRLPGMAIEAFTPSGEIAGPNQPGELVCLKPFPCQPVGFWPLDGYGSQEAVEAAKVRYQQAYFSEFKGVWFHGDHVMLTESRAGNGGGLVMLGRSDGVLNPGGVRFGSAELYDVIDTCFAPNATHSAHTIVDCLAVGQSLAQGTDERVILFIKLLEGEKLTEELERKIRSEIRVRRSARHVPSKIIQVDDIPYTLNGKRVEVPVKKIINGAPVASVNPATLRNPECLTAYVSIGEVLRAEVA